MTAMIDIEGAAVRYFDALEPTSSKSKPIKHGMRHTTSPTRANTQAWPNAYAEPRWPSYSHPYTERPPTSSGTH